MLIARLENWSVVTGRGYYQPPEQAVLRLAGEVYGHHNPRHHDGKAIMTTRLLNASGRHVTTRNTIYELGEPNPAYVAWLKEQGKRLDPERPVKLEDYP